MEHNIPHTLILLGEGLKYAYDLSKKILKQTPDNSPDFFLYSKEDYNAKSMRTFIKEAQKTGNRVFIFDNLCEMPELIQNFLLKIFEEPSTGKYFFLVVKRRERILPTIRSRAVEIRINEDKEDKIERLLSLGFLEKDALVLSEIPQEMDINDIDEKERLIDIFERYLDKDALSLSDLGDFFEGKKGEEALYINLLIIHLRERREPKYFPLIWSLEEAKEHIAQNVSVRNAIIAKLGGKIDG